MAVTLVPLAFLLLWRIFRRRGESWREAFISAAVFHALLLTGMTEGLSLLSGITFRAVVTAWAVLIALGLYLLWRMGHPKGDASNPLPVPAEQPALPRIGRLLLLLLGINALALGIVAIAAPPNNFDSMFWHLPRVMHWIQNTSVSHYPTHTLTQNYRTPGAHYYFLHVILLGGGDRFVNLVQWSSWVGCAIGGSLLAKRLGGHTGEQALSALVAATLPMGILQASTTQNDCLAAFWLICFIYYGLSVSDRGAVYIPVFRLAATLALTLLAKETAYLYVPPFLLWFLAHGRSDARRKVWRPLLWMVGVCAAVNGGHYARNFDLTGSVLGKTSEYNFEQDFLNETMGPRALLSVVSKNIALHLSTPILKVNAVFETGIYLLHRAMGVSANDPRISAYHSVFWVPDFQRHEDTAGNVLHCLLGAFAVMAVLVFRKRFREDRLRGYAACTIGAFLLFCALMKWQPWHSRLHLPLFMVASPWIAAALARLLPLRWTYTVAAVLVAASIPYVVANRTRPLLGDRNIFNTDRLQQYFANQPDSYAAYTGAVALARSQSCTDVGLYVRALSWQYPLWVLFQESGGPSVRIEHVKVSNASRAKAKSSSYREFRPTCILATYADMGAGLEVNGEQYVRAWSQDSLQIYVRR